MKQLYIIALLSIGIVKTLFATDHYWINGSGNWSDPSHWSNSSGGLSCSCIPNQLDNVFFDQNSFPSTGSVTVNQLAYCKDMTWTGVTNSPTLAGTFELDIYGSLTFSNAMNLTYTGQL